MKLAAVNTTISTGFHKRLICPDIPWSGFADRRAEFSQQGFWLVRQNLLQFRHYAKQWWNNPLPVLRWLYNNSLLPAPPEDWPTLRDTARTQGF